MGQIGMDFLVLLSERVLEAVPVERVVDLVLEVGMSWEVVIIMASASIPRVPIQRIALLVQAIAVPAQRILCVARRTLPVSPEHLTVLVHVLAAIAVLGIVLAA